MAERINAVKTSFFGKGAIRLLGPELQKMGVTRALLVTPLFCSSGFRSCTAPLPRKLVFTASIRSGMWTPPYVT